MKNTFVKRYTRMDQKQSACALHAKKLCRKKSSTAKTFCTCLDWLYGSQAVRRTFVLFCTKTSIVYASWLYQSIRVLSATNVGDLCTTSFAGLKRSYQKHREHSEKATDAAWKIHKSHGRLKVIGRERKSAGSQKYTTRQKLSAQRKASWQKLVKSVLLKSVDGSGKSAAGWKAWRAYEKRPFTIKSWRNHADRKASYVGKRRWKSHHSEKLLQKSRLRRTEKAQKRGIVKNIDEKSTKISRKSEKPSIAKRRFGEKGVQQAVKKRSKRYELFPPQKVSVHPQQEKFLQLYL